MKPHVGAARGIGDEVRERLVERFHRLVGIFIESEQRLNQREEEYDLLGVQPYEFGDPRWWKRVDE